MSLKIVAGSLLLVTLLACSGGSAPVPSTLSGEVQPILARHCLRCHGPEIQGGLIMEPGPDLHQRLLSGTMHCGAGGMMKFIEPGAPAKSALWRKVSERNDFSGCGAAMPREPDNLGTPLVELDPEAAEVIRHWISSGAPNN